MMRAKRNISKGIESQSIAKFSEPTSQKLHGRTVRRTINEIWEWMG